MSAHRVDLHNMLRRAGRRHAAASWRHIASAPTPSTGTAVARFADGTTAEADIVVGADGIRSAIRAQHFGADRPRFTEMMAWRCIVPMECVPTRVGPGGEVAIPHGEYFGWIGPNGHVICYPIGAKGDKLNIFGGHVTEQWVEESWSVPSSREELIAAKAGWNEALLDMFQHVEQVYKWGIYDRDPIPQWTDGRVTLLGDAAHPTMPTLAQGANMAIEDGYVLARRLSRGADDIEGGAASLRRRAQAADRLGDAEVARAIRQQPARFAAAVRRPHLAVRQRCGARAKCACAGVICRCRPQTLTPLLLVHLDVGELDDLGPLRGFVDDELAEVGRVQRFSLDADGQQFGCHVSLVGAGDNGFGQLGDDIGGCAGRSADAVPAGGFVTRNRFADGGDPG